MARCPRLSEGTSYVTLAVTISSNGIKGARIDGRGKKIRYGEKCKKEETGRKIQSGKSRPEDKMAQEKKEGGKADLYRSWGISLASSLLVYSSDIIGRTQVGEAAPRTIEQRLYPQAGADMSTSRGSKTRKGLIPKLGLPGCAQAVFGEKLAMLTGNFRTATHWT